MTNDNVLVDQRDGVVRLTMNRPDRRNALSREMVQALREAVAAASSDDGTRVVVLAGLGPAFCAGADIRQYQDASNREQVVEDGARLYDLLDEIMACPKPVIARVQRAAFGGAVGVVAACDLIVAAEDARFSFSEAKLGLVPAVIGKAVVAAIGPRQARALMLTAEPFSADDALQLGLVHRVAPESDLDGIVLEWVAQILSNAPGALRDVKALVSDLSSGRLDADVIRARVVMLAADRRTDPEGQEGLSAFLEKRKPSWNPDSR